MKQIVLTKAGLEKLKNELKDLKTVKRKEVAQALKEARAHGDLSENAEYDAAKQAQEVLEGRIKLLEQKILNGKVIDDLDMPTDVIRIQAKVTLKDCDNEEEEIYILVSEDEADIYENKISIYSPIAQGLVGNKKGEKVAIKVPAGTLNYEIINIEYEE